MPSDLPPPGSDAALEAGCECPVQDNGHGAGHKGTDDYVYTLGCPVHAPTGEEVDDAE